MSETTDTKRFMNEESRAFINWGVRLKNRTFWVAFIPALILAIQAGAAIFGFTIDLEELQGELLAFVDALFALLVVMGIAVDPTTPGVRDSDRAITYVIPGGEE